MNRVRVGTDMTVAGIFVNIFAIVAAKLGADPITGDLASDVPVGIALAGCGSLFVGLILLAGEIKIRRRIARFAAIHFGVADPLGPPRAPPPRLQRGLDGLLEHWLNRRELALLKKRRGGRRPAA